MFNVALYGKLALQKDCGIRHAPPQHHSHHPSQRPKEEGNAPSKDHHGVIAEAQGQNLHHLGDKKGISVTWSGQIKNRVWTTASLAKCLDALIDWSASALHTQPLQPDSQAVHNVT